MVKNNTGGNKSKKQGRKFVAPVNDGTQQKVRRAENEGEIYAAITKIFGGSSCKIICVDGTTRDCIIRRKFNSAGGKRQNMLSIGTWVLVGLRDWEVRTNGEQKCDLLEVYSSLEKERLKQIENNFNFKLLNVASDVSSANNRGTNIAEQSTKYEDNCDIVTFSTSGSGGQSLPLLNNVSVHKEEAAESTNSSSANSSSSEEEEEEVAAPAQQVKNVKTQNDWMIDVDDI